MASSSALIEQVGQLLARVEKLEADLADRDARIAGLQARVGELEADNAALREENTALKQENAELKRRLGLDSTTSSKPPSSDGPTKKPAPRSLRTASGKRPGKQPGEPGTALAQVADPDQVIEHYPSACADCDRPLSEARYRGLRRCQVFDVPEPVGLQVTEHRYHRLACACGVVSAPDPVAGASAPVSYGPRISAVGSYLTSAHHLPVARAGEILADVCGARVSHGWLAGLGARAYGLLEGFEQVLKAAVSAAPVVHADETGARVAGVGHWVHVAGTPALTFYGAHTKRGRAAMQELGVLPAFAGTLVTDALSSYTAYGGAHQLCCAHLLRELQALIEFEDDHAAWAVAMTEVLIGARDLVDVARYQGRACLTGQELASIRSRYARVIAFAKAGPHHALIRRLDERRADYLRFTADFAVPFSSNGAERDLRMVKLQTKVSGGWRTLDGARYFCRIRSFISTVKKQGHRVLDKLTQAFEGNVWLPATT